MAASGYSPIQLYYSTTASTAPAAGNLVSGELAINITDGKLYYKDNAGAVQLLSTSTTANGTANGVLYLNGSKVATSGSALTFDGTLFGVTTSSGADTTLLTLTGNSGIRQQFNPANSSANKYNWRIDVNGLIDQTWGLVPSTAVGGSTFSTPVYQANGNGTQIWSVGSSEAMRLTSTGLGIGTSSPGYKLEVVAPAGDNIVSTFRSGDATAANNAGGGFRSISSATATSRIAQMWLDADGANLSGGDYFYIQKNGNSGNVDLVQYSNAAMTFTTNAIERMRLDSSGNLGLGVTPSGYLANKFVINTGTDSNNGITIASATNRNGSIWFADGTTGDQAYRGGVDYQHTTDTLYLYSGGQGNFQLTAAGNLGLGVTPSAWGSARKAFQLNSGSVYATTAGDTVGVAQNAYNDGTSWKYVSNGYASSYYQNSGGHYFNIAASGTAATNISFTQAMTLDASGRLSVVTTSPTNGGFNPTIAAKSLTDSIGGGIMVEGSGADATLNMGYDGTSMFISSSYRTTAGYKPIAFYTSGSERARITSGGDLLVGTTSAGAGAGFATRLAVDAGGNDVSLFKTSSNGSAPLRAWTSTTTGDATFVNFATETSYTSRGSITYNRTGGLIVYGTSSDYRSKDIIGPVTDSGMVIDSVPVYLGKMKGATQARPMFIAHETPEYAHTGEKDAVDADGNPVYQQMDASSLVPVLWAEVQSLRKRVAQLEGK